MKTIEMLKTEENTTTLFSLFKRFLKNSFLFIAFIVLLLTSLLMASCDDDDEETLYQSYGIIYKTDNSYTITTDKGSELTPSTTHFFPGSLADKDRVIAYFYLVEDYGTGDNALHQYKVDMLDIRKILTKDILGYSEDIADSLGYDPVGLSGVWAANDYITVEFIYSGGQSGLRHMVNLSVHPEKTTDGRILLEFHHNAFDDPYQYQNWSIASFPASQLPVEEGEDTIPLRLKYKSYNGDKYYDFTWKPGSIAPEPEPRTGALTNQPDTNIQ